MCVYIMYISGILGLKVHVETGNTRDTSIQICTTSIKAKMQRLDNMNVTASPNRQVVLGMQ